MIGVDRLRIAVERLLRETTPIDYSSPPYFRVTCDCGRVRRSSAEQWITYSIWDDYTKPWAKRITVCSPACLHRHLPH